MCNFIYIFDLYSAHTEIALSQTAWSVLIPQRNAFRKESNLVQGSWWSLNLGLLVLMCREKECVCTAEKRALLKISPGSPQLLCAEDCYPTAKAYLNCSKEEISLKWSKLKCSVLFWPTTKDSILVLASLSYQCCGFGSTLREIVCTYWLIKVIWLWNSCGASMSKERSQSLYKWIQQDSKIGNYSCQGIVSFCIFVS